MEHPKGICCPETSVDHPKGRAYKSVSGPPRSTSSDQAALSAQSGQCFWYEVDDDDEVDDSVPTQRSKIFKYSFLC